MMKKQKQNLPKENKESASIVTFSTAFAFGAALSYLTTPQGKKAWKKLSMNWEKAKGELYQQGLIPSQELSLDDFKDQYLGKLMESFQHCKSQFQSVLDQAEAVLEEKKQSKKKRKKFRFKGIR